MCLFQSSQEFKAGVHLNLIEILESLKRARGEKGYGTPPDSCLTPQ